MITITRVSFWIALMLQSTLILAADDLGKIHTYKMDQNGFFMQREQGIQEIFYFPKTTLKFSDLPSVAGSDVESLQVNLHVGAIADNPHAEWSGFRYYPLELESQSPCQLPKDLQHVRSMTASGPSIGSTVSGVSDQYICSMQLSIYKGHVQDVKDRLTQMLKDGEILNNLFSVNFTASTRTPHFKWKSLYEKLAILLPFDLKLSEDTAILYLGLAAGDDDKIQSALEILSDDEQGDFIRFALTHLFDEIENGIFLKKKIEDGEYSSLTSKKIVLTF